MILDVKDLKPADLQNFLQHAIAPRPICFASTINKNGDVNLSPFSFFNLFSSNPPIVIFSPARRVRNNTIKHSLENVMEVAEVVINIVDYPMVQQMSLSSCEYPAGVNEFVKAGFTMEPATLVTPPMVKESKVKLECKVNHIEHLGTEGGAGNLVIAEVLRMHIDEQILGEDGKIDQTKFELVARLGGDWYCKVDQNNLFKVPKPNVALGIGIDALPLEIRHSSVLNGNDLGQLANVTAIPDIDPQFSDDILTDSRINEGDRKHALQQRAKSLLSEGKVTEAWQVLLRIR